jgi:hypothetical protein
MQNEKTTEQTKSQPFHPKQVDDPIIVKPGGSLLIEMDVNFRDPHDPKPGKKKGHKHPNATQITYVLIKDKHDKLKTKIEITDKDDQVVICYKNSVNGCDCPM